jgi:hypothetical protein
LRKAPNDAMAMHRLAGSGDRDRRHVGEQSSVDADLASIAFNPAILAEMPECDQPVVRVWNDRAIAMAVQRVRPSSVMICTLEQAGIFFDHTQAHDPARPTPCFLLIILGGPHRGEAIGLRTDQVDLGARNVTFSHQLTQHGYTPVYNSATPRQTHSSRHPRPARRLRCRR